MSSNKKSTKYIVGVAVAVLLPLSFYWITKMLLHGHTYHYPRHYIVDKVDSSNVNGKEVYDTVYHRVANLVLTNQLGRRVSLNNDLKGKIVVVDFFFVNCATICPKLTQHMRMLQDVFRRNPKEETSLDTAVQFISITVNPVHDSFPVLRAYADRYGANHDHWWFLTGDKKDIYDFARNQLFVTASPGDGGAEDFIHTEKWVLLDKDRYIRGYYNGLDTLDMRRCADDIVLLTLEHDRKH